MRGKQRRFCVEQMHIMSLNKLGLMKSSHQDDVKHTIKCLGMSNTNNDKQTWNNPEEFFETQSLSEERIGHELINKCLSNTPDQRI